MYGTSKVLSSLLLLIELLHLLHHLRDGPELRPLVVFFPKTVVRRRDTAETARTADRPSRSVDTVVCFCRAHRARAVDFSLREMPRPVTAPGSDIFFATDTAKDSKLTIDMLLSLITVIRAVSVQTNHSPTIRAACKERRGMPPYRRPMWGCAS